MTLNELLALRVNKEATMVTRWGARAPYAHGVSIFGQVGAPIPRMIDLITFPERVTDASIAQKSIGLAREHDNLDQAVHVHDNGHRVQIEQIMRRGKRQKFTTEYVLLDSFNGKHTKREYWLYGAS